MIIYLDIYFLKNIIFNFLLIYLTSLIIRKKIKIHRVILAAIFGGGYAIVALFSYELFNSILLKIIISIIMLLITFGIKEVTNMLSSFFILAYSIAGIITSLLNVDDQIVMVIFAISMFLIFYSYRKKQIYNEYYEIEITLLQNEIGLIAKLDTCNELKDGIFGESVIVVSEQNIKNNLDKELIKVLKNEMLEIPDKYKNKIKLISFKTISERGIKIGIKLDKLIIYKNEKKYETNAIMILSERKFKNYDVLIGSNVLEGGFKYECNCINKIKNKGAI